MTKVIPITPQLVYKNAVTLIPELGAIYPSLTSDIVYFLVDCVKSRILFPTTKVCRSISKRLEAASSYAVYNSPQIPSIGYIMQCVWTCSHVFTLLSTIGYFRYKISQETELAQICYTIASLSMILTYCVVSYRHFVLLLSCKRKMEGKRTSVYKAKSFYTILKSENTFLLIMSVLVFWSQPNGCKLVSFCIYSFMNMSSHVLYVWFPNGKLTAATTPLFKYFEETLLLFAATTDGLINVVYMYECTYTDGKCQFVVYLTVFILRLENSEICREAILGFCNGLYNCFCRLKKSANGEKVTKGRTMLSISTTEDDCEYTSPILCPSSSNDRFHISTSDYSHLRKRDRIASLVFESFSIVNDLI